jgi:RHS repeat-associated protein
MLMPGRGYSATEAYRYGFNGKENDNEVKGEGGQQDYGMRIYDPRLGRFLSVDPIASDYPWYTPFQFAGNKPIWAIDLDGLEEFARTQFAYNLRQTEIQIWSAERELILRQGSITTWKKNWKTKWQESDNFFAKTSYAIVNGIYTSGQQLASPLSGQRHIENIGGGTYDARGPFGEKQRMENFVEASTTFLPGAPAANKVTTKLFNRAANEAVEQIERDVTQHFLEQASRKIGWTGEIGENYLKQLGGISQKYFKTEVDDGGRFVDQFVNGIAYESKVGYTSLTKDIRMQIAKDADLLARKDETGVQKVVWTFFESPVTGKAGASKPLQEALKNAGIETQIIR